MTGTPARDEALFWVSIYRELLGADELVVRRMRGLIASAMADGRHDIDRLEDVDLVLKEIDRVNRRLAFWSSQIEGIPA